VMLMEPGECHVTRRVSEAGDFDVFQLAPQLVEEAAQRAGLRTPIHLTTASTRDPVLCSAVAALARSIDQPAALLQQELLERVLERLLEHHAEQKGLCTPSSTKRQIARARDYILAHYADDFDLERLSSACGMSKSALSHCMSQELGVSPIGLRTLVRVSHAQRLLAQGIPVSDVAFSVGFCDQAALTRHLRSLSGVTPARYAKMMRG
jgi:AraC-like DNA-binding protein